MSYFVFIFLMIAFAIVYLWIGKRSANKMQGGDEDYFLSRRSLSMWTLTFTLFASQLGAGSLLGSAEAGYKQGWIGMTYPLGMFFGLVCLGAIFGPKLRGLNLTTVAQIFELRYGSKKLRQTASYLSIFPLFFILVAQIVGARKFFLAIGVDNHYFFLAIWSVFLIYTILGGLKAIVKTDIVQVSFILLLFSIAFFLKSDKGSVPFASLISTPFSFTASAFSSLLITTLYMGFEQDMGQKCFAATTPKTIRFSAILAGFLVLFCSLLAVDFGVSLKQSGVILQPGQDALISSVITFTNPIISSCIACGVLMVIFSTTDSLLCAISSNLVLDLPFWKKIPQEKRVFFSRSVTSIVGVLGLITSFYFENILYLLLQSYEFSVCTLCPSIMMAIFSKKISKKGAVSSMIIGAMSFLLLPREVFFVPKEVISLFLSFSAYFLTRAVFKEELILDNLSKMTE
ncbi:MAG: sodium:solute symporter family protein [Chlamydiae bacterium]|nr:sodium:solute symporter family protein [Chlamydiota bacterium]